MKNFRILNNNEGTIWCVKTLDDGRLAAADSKSNLIIYNNETFEPEIIIKNNLEQLWNFTQLKNKNIACSFESNNTLKIIKINNNNEYEQKTNVFDFSRRSILRKAKFFVSLQSK